jgi:cytoskeletal protein CcmA (bactofilin family)
MRPRARETHAEVIGGAEIAVIAGIAVLAELRGEIRRIRVFLTGCVRGNVLAQRDVRLPSGSVRVFQDIHSDVSVA